MPTENKQLVTAEITIKNQVATPKIVHQKLGVPSHNELAFQFQQEANILVKKIHTCSKPSENENIA